MTEPAEAFLTIDGEVASNVVPCALLVDERGHIGFDREIRLTATRQGTAVLTVRYNSLSARREGQVMRMDIVNSLCEGTTITVTPEKY